jgi:hypothetical protein
MDADADAQQLAIDINDFLGERQISARWGTRRYEAETVHAYHQRFPARLVRLGNALLAAGTTRERVSPLFDRQASVADIGQLTQYLKYRDWRDRNEATGGVIPAPGGATAAPDPPPPPGRARSATTRHTNCVVCGWPFTTPGGQTRPNCQVSRACAARVRAGWLPGIGDPGRPHGLGSVTVDEARANQAAALSSGMLPDMTATRQQPAPGQSKGIPMPLKTYGTPSDDRADLERLWIRPTTKKKSLAGVSGNGFVAQVFYSPYPLTKRDGSRKLYLFSGEARPVGTRFVAMHVDGGEHAGWRGDWMVVNSASDSLPLQEWAII